MKKITFLVLLSVLFGGLSTFSQSFNCGDVLIDSRDGKSYQTVLIGNQCWMKENLNYGSKITGGTSQTNNSIAEKYCYNNLDNNCDEYGALYQWDEAVQFINANKTQGVCPNGWHLPDGDDWSLLLSNVTSAAELKEEGTTHWQSPNTGATNSIGFTALPSGANIGSFLYLNQTGDFWHSGTWTGSTAYGFVLYYNNSPTAGDWVSWPKTRALSVRCVNDAFFTSLNINTQPTSDSICEGINHSIFVSVNGDTPEYQWYFNDSPISSANDSSLFIENISTSEMGEYFCKINNLNDTVFSDTVFITVLTGCNHCIDTTVITLYETVYDTITVYDSISVTDTLIIDVTTGLNPPFITNTIKVYPNPTNSDLFINAGNFATMNNYKIRIINTLSQEVFYSVINQQFYQVDLSTWTGNGTYFIYVLDDNDAIKEVRKIVLQ